MELAGSLGDLGTLLPLAIGMIVINGLNPTGLLFIVGTYYILSGLYFGVTVPVQPMKVIGAYSIAMALTPGVITASGLLMGMFMLVIGITGAIHVIGKYTPKSVVRGVQLAVGTLLMVQRVQEYLFSLRDSFAHVVTLWILVSTEQCEFLRQVVSKNGEEFSIKDRLHPGASGL